jgi:HAD superfamily hydrolase (TIGR01509 family)
MAKPDPAIYLDVLKRLGAEPYQAVFVDDLQENIDTANWLGMHGIVFENSAQAMADVESKLA